MNLEDHQKPYGCLIPHKKHPQEWLNFFFKRCCDFTFFLRIVEILYEFERLFLNFFQTYWNLWINFITTILLRIELVFTSNLFEYPLFLIYHFKSFKFHFVILIIRNNVRSFDCERIILIDQGYFDCYFHFTNYLFFPY